MLKGPLQLDQMRTMNSAIASLVGITAAMNSTITAHGTTITAMDSTITTQTAAINAHTEANAQQAATITTMDDTIAALRAEVTAQAGVIATLNDTVAAAGTATDAGTCDGWGPAVSAMTGESDDGSGCYALPTEWDVPDGSVLDVAPWMAALLPAVRIIRGSLLIDATAAPFVSIAAMFAGLETVVGDVTISGSTLASLEGAFAALANVTGSIYIEDNAALLSLDGAFPAVVDIAGSILIYNNAALATMDRAFPVLASVQAVWLHSNAELPPTATAFAALGQAGTRPCLGSADRAGWVRALPNTWSADTTCTAGLPTLVRAGYTLFRLRGFVIPLGDAKSWYRGLCAAVGLRPVSCNNNHGTQYREYNAVPLPQDPFSCQVGAYITAQSGWQDTITYYQGEWNDGSGLATGGVRDVGRIGYPICTNHA